MPDLKKNTFSEMLSNKRFFYFLLIFGVLIKLVLFPVRTGDFVGFLQPWLDFIKTHGYFSSLKFGFYDYTPSYIYILIVIAKTGLNPLFLVKIVSIVFEYLAAFYIGKLAALKVKSSNIVLISLAVIPLIPSVILNSSYLSQCDSIYAAFVLASVYYLLKKKQLVSVILLGVGFAFKMQSIMLLPFFFVMMLKGNIRWYYFLVVPIIFIISLIPAWFFGRPFSDLINVYISQTNHYQFLTMNFPNLYIWINNDFYEPVKIGGVIFTFFFTLISGIWLSSKRFIFDDEKWLQLAFLSAILIPFLLPGMHERYMYLGDLLGVLYFLVFRKNIHFTIGILLVSLYSYIRCSRYNDILPMWPAFFVYLSVIVLVTFDFLKSFNRQNGSNEEN
jgi:Gpi18-like mannosyltransferase